MTKGVKYNIFLRFILDFSGNLLNKHLWSTYYALSAGDTAEAHVPSSLAVFAGIPSLLVTLILFPPLTWL